MMPIGSPIFFIEKPYYYLIAIDSIKGMNTNFKMMFLKLHLMDQIKGEQRQMVDSGVGGAPARPPMLQ